MIDIDLYIKSFAACGPEIGCIKNSQCDKKTEKEPDTSFIPKRTFRRISRLSKMGIYAAHHATLSPSIWMIWARRYFVHDMARSIIQYVF